RVEPAREIGRSGRVLRRGREIRAAQRTEIGEAPILAAPRRKAQRLEARERGTAAVGEPGRLAGAALRVEGGAVGRGFGEGGHAGPLRPRRRAWHNRAFRARPPGSYRPT